MYSCPICESFFPTFFPVSIKKPRRAKCPTCGSLERHRFFYLLMKTKGFMPDSGRFLHFAPEPWLIKKLEDRYGFGYLCTDYEYPPYHLKTDIQNLPFCDELFDGMILFGVLEHIPDDYKAMRELARVLKRAGTAFIHVPLQFDSYWSKRERLGKVNRRLQYGQSNHLRYYGLQIQDDLKANGFQSVEIIAPSDRYTAHQIEQQGLVEASRIIVAKKSH